MKSRMAARYARLSHREGAMLTNRVDDPGRAQGTPPQG
jgi:hypothetical protein